MVSRWDILGLSPIYEFNPQDLRDEHLKTFKKAAKLNKVFRVPLT